MQMIMHCLIFLFQLALVALGSNDVKLGERSKNCPHKLIDMRQTGGIHVTDSKNADCFWFLKTNFANGYLIQTLGLSDPSVDVRIYAIRPKKGHRLLNSQKSGNDFRVITQKTHILIKMKSGASFTPFTIKFTALRKGHLRMLGKESSSKQCSRRFERRCANRCILKDWFCDGVKDCPENDDEKNCPDMPAPSPTAAPQPPSENPNPSIFDIDDWGKIVNGQQANQADWPFIASLRLASNGGHVCGASILSSQWILTAAHCVVDLPHASYWMVDVGRYYKDAGGQEVQRLPVASVHMHPNYNRVAIINDIALLLLQQPIDMSRGNIQVAPVVRNPGMANQLHGGTNCVVAGWGDTKQTASNAVLQQTTVPVVDFNTCRSWYAGAQLTHASFCAGYEQGGIDACQGDSGGPILCRVGNQVLQVGVVSWGIDCAQPRRPGVYTNIAQFADWYGQII